MTIPNNATQDKRTATSSKPPKKKKSYYMNGSINIWIAIKLSVNSNTVKMLRIAR